MSAQAKNGSQNTAKRLWGSYHNNFHLNTLLTVTHGFAVPARYSPRSPGQLQRPASERFRERLVQLRPACRLQQSLPFACWADASVRLLPN